MFEKNAPDECPKCKESLSYEGWTADGNTASCELVCYNCDFKGFVTYSEVSWDEVA